MYRFIPLLHVHVHVHMYMQLCVLVGTVNIMCVYLYAHDIHVIMCQLQSSRASWQILLNPSL